MINWVLGGVIAALVIFITVRAVIRIKNGKSCCDGCREGNCKSGNKSCCK